LRLAIDWEVPGIKANPCNKVPLPKVSNERQRFLSPEEAQRLLATVRSSPNPQLEAIVTFLLLTGARKREALDARWDHIHWEKRSWFIPITKTGQPRHVTLSDGALVMLRRQQLKTGHSGWLFPNHDTGKPFKSVYYAWDTARKEAGLADVRMHDLRHSFASFLINDGRTLYEVQHILGHTQVKTTQRYAHLSHETLLAATNSVNTALGGVFVPMVSASPAAQVQLVQ
jgi:integrase